NVGNANARRTRRRPARRRGPRTRPGRSRAIRGHRRAGAGAARRRVLHTHPITRRYRLPAAHTTPKKRCTVTEKTIPPAPQADDLGGRDPSEDAGRLDGASTRRLVLVLIALVAISEIIPLQNLMIGVAIPKIATGFPQAGAAITW